MALAILVSLRSAKQGVVRKVKMRRHMRVSLIIIEDDVVRLRMRSLWRRLGLKLSIFDFGNKV